METNLNIEGLSIELKPAPFWKRVVATGIDWGILGLGLYVFFIIAILFFAVFGITAAKMGQFVTGIFSARIVGSLTILFVTLLSMALLLGLAGIVHGYFVIQEYKKGTTYGKNIFGLRVVSLVGPQLTLRQCIFRDLMRYIDGLLVLPGLIAILSNDRRQRLGDLVAGTLVIHSATEEEKQNFIYLSSEDFHRLSENFRPKFVPEAICREYLGFSYPTFIYPGRPLSESDRKAWLDYLRPYLSSDEKISEFDPDLILRFFAQHCFALKNA